jgi:hypothetical protein
LTVERVIDDVPALLQTASQIRRCLAIIFDNQYPHAPCLFLAQSIEGPSI